MKIIIETNDVIEFIEITKVLANMYLLETKNLIQIDKSNDIHIDDLNLSTRIKNTLKDKGMYYLSQIVAKSDRYLINFCGFSKKSFQEIKQELKNKGF